ncbi:MAG: hypothetical protein ACW99J_16710 [Candidatus Thorarchaeota archaeon]|jgi:hypothetical protein
MSLSAIAPTESTENLIYALFPIAFTLFVASIIFEDVGLWLPIVAAFSPFLTLFLYEMGWDESRIKGQYEETLLRGSAQDDFYHCNIFIRTWETTLDEPPEDGVVTDYLDSEYSSFVSASVSSYAAKRRMWRQRVSLYILISIPFMIFVFIRVIDSFIRVNSISYISTIVDPQWAIPLYVGALGGLWCIVTGPIWFLILSSKRNRSKEIQSFLDDFVSFVYWQTMVATDAVRNPQEYQTGTEKWIVKTELESLDVILGRKDWHTFLERWKRVKSNIHNLAIVDFKQNLKKRVYNLWSKSIYANRTKIQAEPARRRLTWFIYYSKKLLRHLDVDEADLLGFFNGVQSDNRFIALLNPNLLIEKLPEDLLTEQADESYDTSVVSDALNIVFVGSDGDMFSAVRRMIQALHSKMTLGFQSVAMAQVVMRYVKEMHEHGRKNILSGYGKDQLMSVYSPVQNEMDRIWLLIDWFTDATVSDMRKALGETLWLGVLEDPVLKKIILGRVNDFDGGYSDEVDVIDQVLSIYPEKKEALSRKKMDIQVKRQGLPSSR